ncbi:glutamate-5-semialdehyde dehydrogenase [Novibacillus thermophilus]|uniref:Gamma-glutamyl phosphate reductase n=1 Tax=Novibacillus thermophilus TaxID=1471761 RepID=A0A1U9K4N9_9BACL|nr:glutamate-5-semialdehyde dehydrogenase [Novibacillus thermophilus]AQS55005.1 glutamate-5-semialdehyde dehydrogenase [Novibacillus thermophilus]
MSDVRAKAELAKKSTGELAVLTTEQKNEALFNIARSIEQQTERILQENERDIENGVDNGLSGALLDRLRLTETRLKDIVSGLESLLELPDPVGEVLESWRRDDGLSIEKVRVPLGVIGMIYEARPNVTVDATGLGLKTGNAMLLRGSSSALNSNRVLVDVIRQGLEQSDVPSDAVQLVETTDRGTVQDMLKLNGLIDVIIPRGGAALIQRVVSESSVPVLETGAGICHIYIDRDARSEMAHSIVINAKTDRPGVCNAVETVLVHEAWAEKELQPLVEALEQCGVEVRGCSRTQSFAPSVKQANADDWDTEYLDTILSIKVVDSLNEAVAHIHRHGTRHSECIVTDNEQTANAFLQQVDAACVYHNASTRFTDGFQFGFGAEIGISTQKLHARGPIGLPQLTSYKYVLRGDGHIRGGGPTSC